MGYAGVEVVRGHNQVRCEGGLVWAKKNQKSSRGGSVLAIEVRAGLYLGRGDPIRVGYARIEVQGGRERVRREGPGLGQNNKNRAVEARFWLSKCGRAGFWVEGTLLRRGTLGLRFREGARGGWFRPKKQKPEPWRLGFD